MADVAGDAGDQLAHLEGEAVGLADAHDRRVGEAGAQHQGELPEAVDALVVELGDHDPAVARKHGLEAVR